MKKLILLYSLILLLGTIKSIAQNIELSAGIGQNSFHDFINDDSFLNSTYESGRAYNVAFAIEEIKTNWMVLRLSLEFDHYSGKLDVSERIQNLSIETVASISKSTLSIGIFPINLRLRDRIDVNVGFKVGRLICEEFEGEIKGSQYRGASWNQDIQDKYKRFSSIGYFGLNLRLAYDFKLTEDLSLSPQYLFYFGTSGEFNQSPEIASSLRQYLSVGIQKKLNPKRKN